MSIQLLQRGGLPISILKPLLPHPTMLVLSALKRSSMGRTSRLPGRILNIRGCRHLSIYSTRLFWVARGQTTHYILHWEHLKNSKSFFFLL